jgi:YfiH family protein
MATQSSLPPSNISPHLSLLDWARPPGVQALITHRHGGVSQAPFDSLNLGLHVGDDSHCVHQNRAALLTILPSEPVWLNQVHGTTVFNANLVASESIPQADAAVTNQVNRVLAIMTADCLPVLLATRDGQVIGAAHAGWRGLAAGVIEKTVVAMRELASAQNTSTEIQAYLGPAIGPKSFEVGAEVKEIFLAHEPKDHEHFIQLDQKQKYLANLYGLAQSRLHSLGIHLIEGGQECTYQNPNFFSYRRDRTTGRMGSFIWIESLR